MIKINKHKNTVYLSNTLFLENTKYKARRPKTIAAIFSDPLNTDNRKLSDINEIYKVLTTNKAIYV